MSLRLCALLGTFFCALLVDTLLMAPAARAASIIFAFNAADSAPQYYMDEDPGYGGDVEFTLHGGTSSVGLTLGAAKTIHVGYGEIGGFGDMAFNNEPLPHALSLTGSGATVTQTLPQTDDLMTSYDDSGNYQSVDIPVGPTVTFDMGTQGRIDVIPQEYQYNNDNYAVAPKLAYTLLLRSPAVPVSGLTITPSSVTYPASTTGTVTLSHPAPDAENVVLTSSNAAAASVPAALAFAAGQQTATFPIATYRVDTDTAVTIRASAGGTTKSATLTVKTRPETAFTYSFADIPLIDYSDGQSDLYFQLTGGSGTVGLALNIPYTITVGQYYYSFSAPGDYAGQDVGPLSLSHNSTINGAIQSFSQTLKMSVFLDFDEGDESFSASMSDSQTLLYDFGTQGRVQVTAKGFSYSYNNNYDLTLSTTSPAQYTFLLMSPASSNVYYVSPTGSDSSPGTQTAPFQTIQHAIDGATSGDTLILEDGTYAGTGNTQLDFGGKNLVLTSLNGNAKAILDGGGSNYLFLFHSNEDAALVSNITLQNGNGYVGGAAYVEGNTLVTFTNCQFTGNTAYYGGALYNAGTVTLNACTFTGNKAAYYGGAIASADGGAAASLQGITTLTNCSLTGNTASEYGAGIASTGGTTLQDCTFAANAVTGAAQSYSQAAAVEDASDTTTATNCIFYGDTSPQNTEIDTDGDVSHCDVQGGYDGTGNFNADPKFVRTPNITLNPPDYGDRHLQSASPCIGKGVTLPGVTVDRDGKPRANPPCVGAYEYIAAPVVTSLSPSSATAGGPAFTLSVSGTGFVSTSLVKWNGTELTTTFVSSTKLTASVPASLIASAGTASVTVTTPHVATSSSKTFTITAAGVTVVSLTLSPPSVKGGSATSTGTITLSGPAPSGGLAVTQTSSNTSAATLAGTLNIAAGATSAKFKITTYPVSSTKTVTITSSANGTSKTATLTVTH